MKFVNTTLLFLLFTGLAACRSSRNSTRSDERDLSNLIARLNKKGANDKVMADISEVYNGALLRGRERISNYQFEESPFRYDGILTEMEALQRMYETIGRSAYALRQLKPVNFAPQIRLYKDSAAAAWYSYGETNLQRGERSDLREAYNAFRKAGTYIPNYRNSRTLMQEAFDRAIVHVLINRIQYDDFGMGNWNMGFYNNRDMLWQDRIINELGGRSNTTVPALFYNEYDLQRQRQAPDLVADLVWRNLRFDQPMDQTRTVQRSRQIEIGKDTANRPVYQTVTATLFITRRLLNADGDLNLILTDAVNRRQLVWERYPADFRYQYEFARFNGDQRALTDADRTLINNSQNQPLPSREDALQEMMQRVYHQVVSRIRSAVNW